MEINELDDLGSKPSKLILEEETYAIIGAAMEVYYKLGNGFLEAVYHEALSVEMASRGIPYNSQKELRIEYKGQLLNKTYFADFLCFDQIIVEIKSQNQLTPHEWSQLINYLKVSKLRLGLLFNFGSAGRLEYKRVII
jgi:GxxExxY protein